jgi:hypothetical protein
MARELQSTGMKKMERYGMRDGRDREMQHTGMRKMEE